MYCFDCYIFSDRSIVYGYIQRYEATMSDKYFSYRIIFLVKLLFLAIIITCAI